MNRWTINILFLSFLKLIGLLMPLINNLLITPIVIPIVFLIINFKGILIKNFENNRLHNSLFVFIAFITSIAIDILHYLYFNQEDPIKSIGLAYYLFFSIIPGCIVLVIGLIYANLKSMKNDKK